MKDKIAAGAGMLFAGAIALMAVSMVLSAIAQALESLAMVIGVIFAAAVVIIIGAYALIETRHPGRINAYLDSKTARPLPAEHAQKIDDFFGLVGQNPYIRRELNGTGNRQPRPPRRRKPNGKDETGGVSNP